MTGTEYTTDPTVAEQGEPVEVAEVEPLEVSDGIGPPLVAFTVAGGMALVLVVMTPIPGVKVGGLLIAAAIAVIGFRLLRRGGGCR